MNSYFLRTTDQQALIDELVRRGVLAILDDGIVPAPGVIWDAIGTMYNPSEPDENGDVTLTPITDENGVAYWHANIYSAEPIDLPEVNLITPSAPRRILWI